MKNYQRRSLDDTPKNLQLKTPSITEYMIPVRKLITFKPNTEITEVIDSLLENRITGAPVLNDKGEVVGLIDDKDCLKVLIGSAYYNQPAGKDTVANYMSNVMKSISINSDIVDAANIFVNTKFKRLLIMDDDNKLVGQISRRDVLRAIKDFNMNTW